MAQQTSIETSAQLHDLLAADQDFSALVGSLKFDSGSPVPALLVAADGSNPLADLKRAEGLCVVIIRDPEITSFPLLNGGSRIARKFKIRLVQFASSAANLQAACEHLANAIPGSAITPMGGPAGLLGDGQAVVNLPENAVYVS